MLYVVGVSAAMILIGVFAGIFDFIGTLPIYIILALVISANIGTRYGGWQWARFIPILMCFGMGIYFSINSGLGATGLFYALAILLAGTLVGKQNKVDSFCIIHHLLFIFCDQSSQFWIGRQSLPNHYDIFLIIGDLFFTGLLQQ